MVHGEWLTVMVNGYLTVTVSGQWRVWYYLGEKTLNRKKKNGEWLTVMVSGYLTVTVSGYFAVMVTGYATIMVNGYLTIRG